MVKLSFKQYGSGRPLIILHGLLGAGGNWHTLSRQVFSKQWSVLAVDLRNHGQSPHDPQMDYHTMAGDVHQLIRSEGMASAHVLGHSMGGKVAMQLALEHLGVVDRLIVVDVAPRAYDDRHSHIVEALKALDLSAHADRRSIDAELAKSIESNAIRQFLLKNLRHTPEGYVWIMNLEAIEASYDAIAGPITAEGSFGGPVLVVSGGASDYVTAYDKPEIRRLFPAARFVTVPNVGHWVHAEAPAEFARVVTEFLEEE